MTLCSIHRSILHFHIIHFIIFIYGMYLENIHFFWCTASAVKLDRITHTIRVSVCRGLLVIRPRRLHHSTTYGCAVLWAKNINTQRHKLNLHYAMSFHTAYSPFSKWFLVQYKAQDISMHVLFNGGAGSFIDIQKHFVYDTEHWLNWSS